MWRRIYFAFPAPAQARRAVTELEQAGVPRADIHAIARDGIDIGDLPKATDAQRRDRIWLWDRMLWGGSLILFALLLVGFAYAAGAGSIAGAVVSALLAIGVYLIGARFAQVIPHGHLSSVRVPLLHGEVVLMVDAPFDRVAEIIGQVSGTHPEVDVGGVGWTPHMGTL